MSINEKTDLFTACGLRSEKSERDHLEYCKGRRGIKDTKLEDFKDQYDWQLEDYGNTKKKAIVSIPLQLYYDIGIFCIENESSINEFMAQAIRNQYDMIQRDLVGLKKLKNSIKYEVKALK